MSLIFWSVMIIVTLTYVTLVMRAGSDGGGKSWRSSRYCGGAPGRRPAMTLAALGLSAPHCSSARAWIYPCDLARVR